MSGGEKDRQGLVSHTAERHDHSCGPNHGGMHDHSHAHSHDDHDHSHAPRVTASNERTVLLALILTAGFMIAEVIGVSTFTVLLLAVAYPLVRSGSIVWARFILTSRTHLAGFVVVLLTVPILLILY